MAPRDVVETLVGQSETLRREFAVEIAGERLHSLPEVLGGTLPSPRGLPRLLLALARAFARDGSLDAHAACQVGPPPPAAFCWTITEHFGNDVAVASTLSSAGIASSLLCCTDQ